jgi:hypothetical protein
LMFCIGPVKNRDKGTTPRLYIILTKIRLQKFET